MKLRRLLSVLLMLAMMVQVLPLSAIADGSEEVTEYVYVTDTVTLDDTEDPSNDELFEGYIEQLFGISSNDGIMTAATYTGEDALEGAMLDIYNELKSAVAKIASGEETSSIVAVPVTYTASYYGVSSGSEAWSAFSSEFSSSTLVNYLLRDYPYEMYWFDKQTGWGTNISGSVYSTYFAVTITFTFYVASDYQDTDNTTVNSTKVATAVAAAEYAQEIAETYQYYTEIDKIYAFKEIICDLTSYNYDAAENQSDYPYGDIWQLVYVFDQDDSTEVVCEGYSKAFQYLCDLSGIECITVTGYMSDGSSGGNHMWNVVYYDDVNYLVDVTNSDTGTAGQNGGLFMVCADDATAIYDGTSGYYGYAFYVNKTITYIYDSTTLNLYPYDEYLALGNVATGTTVTTPSFYGKALTLDGEIGVTYYFTMDGVTNPDDYYLMAKFEDDTYYVKYDAAEQKTIDDVTYYRYTVYVNPTEISSAINAYLTDGTNKVELDNYSVYDYCAYAIKTETEVWQEVQALCEAVLNYGYYAETWYNNSSTSTLQSKIYDLDSYWTDPVTSFDISALSSYETDSDGIDKTLALGGGVYIRVYVTDTTATYTVDGEELEVGVDSNGYYVEFKVYAKEMYKTFTVLMNGNTYTTYSVYNYIYNVCNSSISGDITESLQDLCKSIYYYGELAKAYNNWN